jgi:O-antigen/teichoic acid export membrane protein
VLLVLVTLAAGLALLARPLITTVFGEEFGPAVKPFVLLLPGTVCLTLWYLLSLFLVVSARRPGLTTILQTAALGFSIPIYYVAVREWGMTGGAVVSSCVYAVLLVAGVTAFVRLSDARLRDLVPRPSDITTVFSVTRATVKRTPSADA